MTKCRYFKRLSMLLSFCLATLLLPFKVHALTCPSPDLFYNSTYNLAGEYNGLYFINFGIKHIAGVNWVLMGTVDADNERDAITDIKKVLDNKNDYQIVQQDSLEPTVDRGTSYCVYIVRSATLTLTWTGLFIAVTPVPKNAVSFISNLPPVK